MSFADKLASLPYVLVLAIAVAAYGLKAFFARSSRLPKRVAATGYQWVDTFLFAWVAVMCICTPVLGASYYIPSESMQDTLQVHDRVVVERPGFWLHGPQRGDILVFKAPPNATDTGYEEDYIKRCIGLPGEKLAVIGGRVYINDHVLTEPYTKEPSFQDFGPIVVPRDHYFMMGDNRNNSADSRYWGPLPKSRIVGRAVLRFWPLNAIGGLGSPKYDVPEKPQPALGIPFITRRFLN